MEAGEVTDRIMQLRAEINSVLPKGTKEAGGASLSGGDKETRESSQPRESLETRESSRTHKHVERELIRRVHSMSAIVNAT